MDHLALAERALDCAIARWTPAWREPDAPSVRIREAWDTRKDWHHRGTYLKKTELCDTRDFTLTATARGSHIDYYLKIKHELSHHLPRPRSNPLRSHPEVDAYCRMLAQSGQ